MLRRPLIWVLALLLAAAALVVVPIVSTLQPDYYRRYPEFGLRMDHWETSTHSRVSCAACHIDPGAAGFIAFTVEAVPAFYSQLLNGPAETNLLKAPGKAACQKCHTGYRRVAPSGDLLIPHKAHVEVLEMECVTCHVDLVHSLNRHGFNRPEMELCLECHDGETADAECVSCHTRKQTPETHERADWLQVHGTMVESEDCGSCHDWTPGYCVACHEQRPASHVGNWKTGHSSAAQTRGDGCTVCHGGEEFCRRCH